MTRPEGKKTARTDKKQKRGRANQFRNGATKKKGTQTPKKKPLIIEKTRSIRRRKGSQGLQASGSVHRGEKNYKLAVKKLTEAGEEE